MNMKINYLLAITILLILQSTIAQNTNDSSVDSSYGTGIVNTHIYTIVDYHGQQIYVYKSLSNDSKNQIFYYIPIIVPQKEANTSWIWTSGSGELRLNIVFGNDEIDDMVRQKIIETGETDRFDVAPLIIDSFSAFIVNGNSEPVLGVQPFRRTQPNDKRMIIRFECSSESIAQKVMSGVINGDYEIQFAFFFAGFNKVSTNIVSITSDSLKSVLSKTVADGGNTNAIYIHRDQTNNFASSYLANVRKIIYKEDPNSDTSSLTAGLEEEFILLIQKAMKSSNQEKIELNVYGEVWSSSDLNPDRLTSELNKLFTYNQAETDYRNTTDKYFNFDKKYADELSKSTGTKDGFKILNVSADVEFNNSLKKAKSGETGNTTHDVISLADIKRYLDQKYIETEWNGEKIIPKSFQVYKLADITDNLQLALMAIQLTAEKTNNAMMRTFSTLNLPPNFDELPQTIGGKDVWLVKPGAIPEIVGIFPFKTVDTVAFDLPSVIPNTAKTFRINVFESDGGVKTDNRLVNVWLWTECVPGEPHSYHQIYNWYPQLALSYDNSLLSFDHCSSNRKLYVKSDRVVDGDANIWIYVVSYKT